MQMDYGATYCTAGAVSNMVKAGQQHVSWDAGIAVELSKNAHMPGWLDRYAATRQAQRYMPVVMSRHQP
jgi:hypothetical protein